MKSFNSNPNLNLNPKSLTSTSLTSFSSYSLLLLVLLTMLLQMFFIKNIQCLSVNKKNSYQQSSYENEVEDHNIHRRHYYQNNNNNNNQQNQHHQHQQQQHKNTSSSYSSINQHVPKKQQQIRQLQQLYKLLHQPHIFRLLKLNLKTIESKKSALLQDQYEQQEIQDIIKIKKFLLSFNECPQDKPFYTMRGLGHGQSEAICTACEIPYQLYDVQKGECANCTRGTRFDPDRKQCITMIGSTKVSLNEMQLEKAQELIIIRANKFAAGMMSFVHEKMLDIKCKIGQCNEEEMIDISRLRNSSLNSSSSDTFYPYYLPPVVHPVPPQPANKTNPHYLNLVIFIRGQKQQDYFLKEGDIPCPKEKPFFSRDQCVSCPEPNHLFDDTTKLCVQCSSAHIYSLKKHKCVINPKISIQKNQQNNNSQW